jgi:hypothetical protein
MDLQHNEDSNSLDEYGYSLNSLLHNYHQNPQMMVYAEINRQRPSLWYGSDIIDEKADHQYFEGLGVDDLFNRDHRYSITPDRPFTGYDSPGSHWAANSYYNDEECSREKQQSKDIFNHDGDPHDEMETLKSLVRTKIPSPSSDTDTESSILRHDVSLLPNDSCLPHKERNRSEGDKKGSYLCPPLGRMRQSCHSSFGEKDEKKNGETITNRIHDKEIGNIQSVPNIHKPLPRLTYSSPSPLPSSQSQNTSTPPRNFFDSDSDKEEEHEKEDEDKPEKKHPDTTAFFSSSSQLQAKGIEEGCCSETSVRSRKRNRNTGNWKNDVEKVNQGLSCWKDNDIHKYVCRRTKRPCRGQEIWNRHYLDVTERNKNPSSFPCTKKMIKNKKNNKKNNQETQPLKRATTEKRSSFIPDVSPQHSGKCKECFTGVLGPLSTLQKKEQLPLRQTCHLCKRIPSRAYGCLGCGNKFCTCCMKSLMELSFSSSSTKKSKNNSDAHSSQKLKEEEEEKEEEEHLSISSTMCVCCHARCCCQYRKKYDVCLLHPNQKHDRTAAVTWLKKSQEKRTPQSVIHCCPRHGANYWRRKRGEQKSLPIDQDLHHNLIQRHFMIYEQDDPVALECKAYVLHRNHYRDLHQNLLMEENDNYDDDDDDDEERRNQKRGDDIRKITRRLFENIKWSIR